MLNRLPEFIDPFLMADRSAGFEGHLPISSFDRITDLLIENSGNLDFKLDFGRMGKLAIIEGKISGFLFLKCQRCLEKLEWAVNSEIHLVIIATSAQANNLPEGYEPLLLEAEEKILLKNIIEDEILLGLPAIPKHKSNCVAPDITKVNNTPSMKAAGTQKQNPFSILADLKITETNHGSTKK